MYEVSIMNAAPKTVFYTVHTCTMYTINPYVLKLAKTDLADRHYIKLRAE
jgi:hypothetical protein